MDEQHDSKYVNCDRERVRFQGFLFMTVQVHKLKTDEQVLRRGYLSLFQLSCAPSYAGTKVSSWKKLKWHRLKFCFKFLFRLLIRTQSLFQNYAENLFDRRICKIYGHRPPSKNKQAVWA